MKTAPAWSETVPGPLAPALVACATGRLPPNVALMRLLSEAAEEVEAERALAAALSALDAAGRRLEAERLRQFQALWRASPGAWDVVRSTLAEAEHDTPDESGEAAVARWAAVFDRLAQRSPEAAVALYSLGRPDLLDAATGELVRIIRSRGLLSRRSAVLDLGCGIGRMTAALAGEAGTIVGTDVSAAMIAAARRRCAGLPNVRLMTTDGRGLSAFEDASLDLVLAVDVFPYLVHAGLELAARHVVDAARVLRPGGTLLIFNLSYRGDAAADRADLARMADAAGLSLVRSGGGGLSLWDGTAYQLQRTG